MDARMCGLLSRRVQRPQPQGLEPPPCPHPHACQLVYPPTHRPCLNEHTNKQAPMGKHNNPPSKQNNCAPHGIGIGDRRSMLHKLAVLFLLNTNIRVSRANPGLPHVVVCEGYVFLCGDIDPTHRAALPSSCNPLTPLLAPTSCLPTHPPSYLPIDRAPTSVQKVKASEQQPNRPPTKTMVTAWFQHCSEKLKVWQTSAAFQGESKYEGLGNQFWTLPDVGVLYVAAVVEGVGHR